MENMLAGTMTVAPGSAVASHAAVAPPSDELAPLPAEPPAPEVPAPLPPVAGAVFPPPPEPLPSLFDEFEPQAREREATAMLAAQAKARDERYARVSFT
jgi:hypothetical protein